MIAAPATAKNPNQPLASGSVKTVTEAGVVVKTSYTIYDNDARDLGSVKTIVEFADGSKGQVKFDTSGCVYVTESGLAAVGAQTDYKGNPLFDAPFYIMFLYDDPDERVTFGELWEFDLDTFQFLVDENGDLIPISQAWVDDVLCAEDQAYWSDAAELFFTLDLPTPVSNGRITIRH